MIRLRALRPRQIRSIRHWAIELAVVVVGVLLALWAQAWFEGRREDRRLAELEGAMREELRSNYLLYEFHNTDRDCHHEFSRRMRELLLKSGNQWPGYSTRFIDARDDGDEAPVGIVGVQTSQVSLSAWRNAEDSGLLARMSPEKVEQYRFAYQRMMFLDGAIKSVEQARNQLSGLIDPVPLSDDTRVAALRDLVAFNNGLLRRSIVGDEIVNDLVKAGIGSTDALEARFVEAAAIVREDQERWGFECAIIPENRLPRQETLQ